MQVTRSSDDVIAYRLNVHMTALCIDRLNLHPVCVVNVLLINEQILDHFFKQLCLRVIAL